MERQRQRTLLEWVRDKVESFFAAVSTFVARALLGKNLFEEEYRKLSMQEEAKKMFDNTEKDKGVALPFIVGNGLILWILNHRQAVFPAE